MTKKDYILIGDQFKNAYQLAKLLPPNSNTTPLEVIEAVVKDFCLMLSKDNPRFNTDRFNKHIFS